MGEGALPLYAACRIGHADIVRDLVDAVLAVRHDGVRPDVVVLDAWLTRALAAAYAMHIESLDRREGGDAGDDASKQQELKEEEQELEDLEEQELKGNPTSGLAAVVRPVWEALLRIHRSDILAGDRTRMESSIAQALLIGRLQDVRPIVEALRDRDRVRDQVAGFWSRILTDVVERCRDVRYVSRSVRRAIVYLLDADLGLDSDTVEDVVNGRWSPWVVQSAIDAFDVDFAVALLRHGTDLMRALLDDYTDDDARWRTFMSRVSLALAGDAQLRHVLDAALQWLVMRCRAPKARRMLQCMLRHGGLWTRFASGQNARVRHVPPWAKELVDRSVRDGLEELFLLRSAGLPSELATVIYKMSLAI